MSTVPALPAPSVSAVPGLPVGSQIDRAGAEMGLPLCGLSRCVKDSKKDLLMRFNSLMASCLFACAIGGSLLAEPTTMPTTKPAKQAVGDSCKLSPAQLATQRHELIPGLFKRADKVEDIPKGLRFTFASNPGLLSDLAKIMDREQDCCSFLRIQLTMEPSEGPITFEVTGPEGTGDMLRKL